MNAEVENLLQHDVRHLQPGQRRADETDGHSPVGGNVVVGEDDADEPHHAPEQDVQQGPAQLIGGQAVDEIRMQQRCCGEKTEDEHAGNRHTDEGRHAVGAEKDRQHHKQEAGDEEKFRTLDSSHSRPILSGLSRDLPASLAGFERAQGTLSMLLGPGTGTGLGTEPTSQISGLSAMQTFPRYRRDRRCHRLATGHLRS